MIFQEYATGPDQSIYDAIRKIKCGVSAEYVKSVLDDLWKIRLQPYKGVLIAPWPSSYRDTYVTDYSRNEELPGLNIILINNGEIQLVFSKDSGYLRAFSINAPTKVQDKTVPSQVMAKNFNLSDCLDRLNRFYAVTKLPYELVVDRSFYETTIVANDCHFIAHFKDPAHQYPTGGGVEAIFERAQGLPIAFWISQPLKVVDPETVITKDDAMNASAEAVRGYMGWSEVVVGAQDPRFEVPDYRVYPNQMTEKHLDFVKKRLGTLIYEVSVNNANTWNEKDQRYDSFVQAYVDAETNLVIALLPSDAMIGSFKAHPHVKFQWSPGIYSVNGVTGKLRPVEKGSISKTGKTVLLHQGKKVIIASYAKKSKLVWVTDGASTYAAQPDNNLIRAINLLKPVKPFKRGSFKVPPRPNSGPLGTSK